MVRAKFWPLLSDYFVMFPFLPEAQEILRLVSEVGHHDLQHPRQGRPQRCIILVDQFVLARPFVRPCARTPEHIQDGSDVVVCHEALEVHS